MNSLLKKVKHLHRYFKHTILRRSNGWLIFVLDHGPLLGHYLKIPQQDTTIGLTINWFRDIFFLFNKEKIDDITL